MKNVAITLICLLTCILIVSGCTAKGQSDAQQTEQSTQNNQPDTTETKAPEESESIVDDTTASPPETNEPETTDPKNIYSKLAKEYFLLPFENYSWEKEFDTEYVLIHFTSNVVADRNNPHDLAAAKKIFEDGFVSSHYIIDRDGKIYCFIPENRSAWHAGVGTYANDEKYTNKMNKYSIGIEMLAIGSYDDMKTYLSYEEYQTIKKEDIGYTDAQYESLKALLSDICERNNISYDREHIIGHEEYSSRKSDPGELFDWSRLFEE